MKGETGTQGETGTSIDTLIILLRGKGRFQNRIHFLLALTYLPLVFNHVIMAFLGSKIPHTCMAGLDLLTETNSTLLSLSKSPTTQRHVTNLSRSQCSTRVSYSDGQDEVIECTEGQWEYFPTHGESNIVNEFDLVCSDNYLTNLATAIYFAGVMLGGLLFGDLADRFGRKPVLLFTLYCPIIVGIVTSFSVNYTMFVCLRFIHGVMIQGAQSSAYVMAMELFHPKRRPYAGCVLELFFGGGIMLLAGLAYCIRNWRYLQLTINLVVVVTLFYPWIVPESLRWLIIKGKTEEAERQIWRICKLNKVRFPDKCWETLKRRNHAHGAAKRQYNITHLFRTWQMMKITVISFYLWFITSTTYYGLTFKLTALKGDRYVIFFISGLIETLCFASCIPIMNRFGRKKPLFCTLALGAVMCLASGLVDTFGTGLGYLTTGLALAGKCSISMLFVILFVYATEVFPTVVRNIGMGAGMFWTRLGALLSPQINHWTDIIFHFDAIYIYGILALLASALVIPLPETHQKRLPDTIGEEVEEVKEEEEEEQKTWITLNNNAGVMTSELLDIRRDAI